MGSVVMESLVMQQGVMDKALMEKAVMLKAIMRKGSNIIGRNSVGRFAILGVAGRFWPEWRMNRVLFGSCGRNLNYLELLRTKLRMNFGEIRLVAHEGRKTAKLAQQGAFFLHPMTNAGRVNKKRKGEGEKSGASGGRKGEGSGSRYCRGAEE